MEFGRPQSSLFSTRLVMGISLLLVIVPILATGCSPELAPAAHAGPQTATAFTTASVPPSPTPSPWPTRARLPAFLAAATSRPVSRTPTATASPTPSATPSSTATPVPTATATPTLTPSPSPTLIPSPTATWTSTPSPSPSPEFSPTPVPTTELTQDILHILLIGGDRNYVLDMNTDTLIVAVVQRQTRQVSLLSIPRDLWVYIPTYGWGRINVAHRIGARFKYPEGGGPGLLKRTIEENLGIPIDHWVRVGYGGFSRAVDELGGVDMVVPCRINLRYQAPTSSDQPEMILEPGLHHLDGATTLRYVRTRRGETDFERARRQQQFLREVWYQFKSPETVLRIPALWLAMKGAFATDLKLGDLLALAPIALELEPQRVRSLYIGRGQVESWTTPDGAQVLHPIPERVQQVVARLYAPPAAEDTVAAEAARIQIHNGTGRPYLARIAADQLRWQGISVVGIGLADRSDYKRTQIVVFADKPQALQLLTRFLRVKSENVRYQLDPSQPADPAQPDLLVILGADYDPCR